MSKIKDALLDAEERYGEEFHEAWDKWDEEKIKKMVYNMESRYNQQIRDYAYMYYDQSNGELDHDAVCEKVSERLSEDIWEAENLKHLDAEDEAVVCGWISELVDQVLDDYDYETEWREVVEDRREVESDIRHERWS